MKQERATRTRKTNKKSSSKVENNTDNLNNNSDLNKTEPKHNPENMDCIIKSPKTSKGHHNFYIIADDALIINTLAQMAPKTSIKDVAQQLSSRLKRSVESVRDRIKRYILKLNSADKKQILKVAKENPNHYVYFKSNEDNKIVEKISATEPLIHRRDVFRPPRQSKKIKKAFKPKIYDFGWLLKKINANDPYFAIDHSVQLLNCIFNKLLEENVDKDQIEKFILEQKGAVSLNEILSQFIKPKASLASENK